LRVLRFGIIQVAHLLQSLDEELFHLAQEQNPQLSSVIYFGPLWQLILAHPM